MLKCVLHVLIILLKNVKLHLEFFYLVLERVVYRVDLFIHSLEDLFLCFRDLELLAYLSLIQLLRNDVLKLGRLIAKSLHSDFHAIQHFFFFAFNLILYLFVENL